MHAMNVSCMEYKYARASYGIIGKRDDLMANPHRITTYCTLRFTRIALDLVRFPFARRTDTALPAYIR